MLAELICDSISPTLKTSWTNRHEAFPYSRKFYSKDNLFLILMDTPLPNRILVGEARKSFQKCFISCYPLVVSRCFFSRLWKTIGNQTCRWNGFPLFFCLSFIESDDRWSEECLSESGLNRKNLSSVANGNEKRTKQKGTRSFVTTVMNINGI